MRDVAVIGIGITKFGELWNDSLRQLGIQAGLLAMHDAKIGSKDIDAMFIGNMAAGRAIEQYMLGPLIVDTAGLSYRHIPAARAEAACASGSLAFRMGCMAVASGMHDIVVVGGAEKITDMGDVEAIDALASSADRQWEAFLGATYPSLFAMIARRFMHEGLATREQMAQVAVKNHEHGILNPIAQFKNKISLESVINAPLLADPLTVMDSFPISDGAAAVVLCPMKKAVDFVDCPILVKASAQATDMLALHSRKDITIFEANRVAAKEAFRQAGMTPDRIQVAEVHDCFTISELMALEDMGFYERGKAGKAIEDGETRLGGRIPVNTSGGLKARGHPYGATGLAQVVEIVQQLRNKAGERQVKDARVGLTHNFGGTGSNVLVHIFEGPEGGGRNA